MIELKLTPKMWLPIAASSVILAVWEWESLGAGNAFKFVISLKCASHLGQTHTDIKLELGRNACALCILNAFTFVSTRLKYLRIFFWHILYIFVYGYLDQSGGKLRESRISGPQLKCKTRVAAISIFTPMTGYNLGICVHLYIWPWSAVRWLIVNQPDTSLPALCSIIIASCMFYNADDHMYEHLALHWMQREKNIGHTVLYYYRNFEYSL